MYKHLLISIFKKDIMVQNIYDYENKRFESIAIINKMFV